MFTTKLLAALVLTAVTASALSWYLPRVLSSPSSSAAVAATERLTTQAAPVVSSISSAEDVWIKATGRVEPYSGLRRLVFKTEGVIRDCRVQAGSQVKKGDVLMVLDNHEQEAAVAVAQSELQQAKAERTKALSGAHPEEIAAARSKVQMLQEQVRFFRTEFERTRRTAVRSAASEQEYAQSWTAWVQKAVSQLNAEAELRKLEQQVRPEDRALADARVERAQAQLKLAQHRLEDACLKAPCDGTVLEVLKNEGEGQRLLDNEPVLIFADLTQLCVQVSVEQKHAAQLGAGQEVVISGRGLSGATYPGRIGLVKHMLSSRSGRARSGGEQDVLQVLVEVESSFRAPVGLPVDVNIHLGS